MVFVFIFLSFTVWATEPLPVVDASTFTEGKSWTWDYFDKENQLYSTERYTVLRISEDKILIEMATQFPGEAKFNSHHRLLVSIDRCLGAYRLPSRKLPWSYRMFYRHSEGWQEISPPNTLAFEEKFNCNPHHHDSREFFTELKHSEAGQMFRHKRWRRMDSSWFFLDGERRAVAAEKIFKRSSRDSYHFRLRP